MEAKLRRKVGAWGAGAWVLALALAACQAAPPAAPSLRVGLLPDGRTLEIRADDPLAVTAAELRLPGAAPILARAIQVTAPPPDLPPERGGVGVGASGGSSSGMDVGVLFRVPVSRAEPRPRLTRSVARIELPDPELYRARAAEAIVRIVFGPAGDAQRIVDFPAP
ncbi:MAG: hypothetical protein NBV67_06390 [Tagaea sp.]|nr:hypothetical protein [Tagaea sp.]